MNTICLGRTWKIFRRKFFAAFMELEVTGVSENFWQFDGRERAIKIEYVLAREEFCSFGGSVIIECSPPWKGVYHRENQKIQHLFKASVILLANTATPYKYTNFWPCLVLLRVITRRSVAFYSSPISCNIIQIGRCASANARAMKFANYLHLQTGQLLKHIRSFLGKTKEISKNYWQNGSIKYYLKCICSHQMDKLNEKC